MVEQPQEEFSFFFLAVTNIFKQPQEEFYFLAVTEIFSRNPRSRRVTRSRIRTRALIHCSACTLVRVCISSCTFYYVPPHFSAFGSRIRQRIRRASSALQSSNSLFAAYFHLVHTAPQLSFGFKGDIDSC